MEKAIEVQNLHKAFGDRQAVQGVNFTVEKGEIFSLLGPNGAGKTTTISMLSCLLRPDAGDALVMGHSIRTDQWASSPAWVWSRRRSLSTKTCRPVRT